MILGMKTQAWLGCSPMHTCHRWLVALLLVASRVCAASPEQCPSAGIEGLDDEQWSLVQALGRSDSHAPDLAHALLDRIGPRLTGSPELESALEWAAHCESQPGIFEFKWRREAYLCGSSRIPGL